MIAGETVTRQTLAAAAVIITAVFIIITFGPRSGVSKDGTGNYQPGEQGHRRT
jgi:predicted anti-sigma-YlaC factor YlaD